MYERHFGLESPAFRITPDTRRFYPGAQRGAVLAALAYAIDRGEGIVKLSGEVGSGKTMLCRMLAERLSTCSDVVYLTNPGLGREEVLRAIAQDLQLPAGGDRLEVLQALRTYLFARHAEGRRVTVFVEEAQGMSLDALEEIRLLSNLETRQDKLLQLVLFGQPELDEHLAVHEARQLRDRIGHSLTLPPLTLRDIRDYIPFRLRAAGWRGGDPFTPFAYWLLARASKGLIRRVHILADKALLAAYADGVRQVRLRHVRRALADTEFAPRTYSLPRVALAALSGVVLAGAGTLTGSLVARNGADTLPDVAELIKIQPAAGNAMPDRATAMPVPARPAGSQVAGSADSQFLQRVAAARAWLAADAGARFTVQIMTTDDARHAPLDRFLLDPAVRAHVEQLYIAPARVAGAMRWSVLYGSYTSYADAQRALHAIPAGLKTRNPYLRSLSAVKKEADGQWLLAQQDS